MARRASDAARRDWGAARPGQGKARCDVDVGRLALSVVRLDEKAGRCGEGVARDDASDRPAVEEEGSATKHATCSASFVREAVDRGVDTKPETTTGVVATHGGDACADPLADGADEAKKAGAGSAGGGQPSRSGRCRRPTRRHGGGTPFPARAGTDFVTAGAAARRRSW